MANLNNYLNFNNKSITKEEQNYTIYGYLNNSDFKENIKNITLRIATLQNYPLSYAIKTKDDTWEGKGVAFELLKILQEMFKFNFTVVVPEDVNSLGVPDSGIYGLFQREEVDLAAAFLPKLLYRQSILRYSTDLDTGYWMILFKRPVQSILTSGLLQPFELPVWLLILLTLVVFGPVMYLIIKQRKRIIPEATNNHSYPLSSCYWHLYGGLLRQSSVLEPISDPSRLIFATWWIFITIITAMYTANLIAFLKSTSYVLPINSPIDIVDKKYHWVTQKGNLVEEMVTNKRYGELNYLNADYGLFTNEGNETILKHWVLEENYLYIKDQPGMNHVLLESYKQRAEEGIDEKNRCQFALIPWPLLRMPRAFAYSNNFTWKYEFDTMLRRMVESGIVEHLIKENLPKAPICPLDLNTDENLTNWDLLTTYLTLIAGIVISVLTLLIELLFRRSKYLIWFHRPKDEENQEDKNFEKDISSLPPPPSYNSLFRKPLTGSNMWKKITFNGREYWERKSKSGLNLLPIRAPSALLFQYTIK